MNAFLLWSSPFSAAAFLSLAQASAPQPPWWLLLAGLLVGGGGIYGLLKVRVEKTSIITEASERAVKVLEGSYDKVFDNLQRQLEFAKAEVARLTVELGHAQEDRVRLQTELQVLRERIEQLEARLGGRREGDESPPALEPR